MDIGLVVSNNWFYFSIHLSFNFSSCITCYSMPKLYTKLGCNIECTWFESEVVEIRSYITFDV